MSDKQCIERISILEHHIDEVLTYRKMREANDRAAEQLASANQKILTRDLHELKVELAHISDYLSTQKGFIGGAVFIIGAIASVFTLFADKLMR